MSTFSSARYYPNYRSVKAVVNGQTLDATHQVAICDSAVAATINLPACTTCPDRFYTIKSINSGTVTVKAAGAELIDAENTKDLSPANASIDIVCTGTNWKII